MKIFKSLNPNKKNMKKLFTVCFLAIFISPAFSQISNASFEKWDTVTVGTDEFYAPSEWVTFDAYFGNLGSPPDTNTIFNVEGRDGSRAVKLYQSAPGSDKSAVPFMLLQHENENKNKRNGIPLTNRPTSLKGYFKCTISNTDSFGIGLLVGNDIDDENGRGIKMFRGEVGTYTAFEIPINYTSQDQVDSLFMIVGNLSLSNTGSIELTLDDLSLSYDPVGIDNRAIDISFYPNPVSDVLNLGLKNLSTHEFSTLEIVDLNGRVLFLTNEITEKINLPASLKAGTYLIRLKGDKNTFIKKLVKI
jgi:hypothetical protein